ncbi:MAG: PAS domain S-box protein, partial [Syntrophomonas sp.]|nr:PAS domain S-box protein [Syntrophomonas sp.]
IYAVAEQGYSLLKEIHEQGSIRNLKTKFRIKSGEIRTFLLSGEVVDMGGEPYLLAVSKDITPYLIMEERLRKSEAELRIIMKNANGVIFTLSPERKFIFVSPGWTESLGHEIAEVEGCSFELFIHPDDVNLCISFFEKVVFTGEPQKGVEYRVKHQDGSWRWHTTSIAPVNDEAGNRLCYVGMAIDITERQQIEEALRESERRFRDMLENVQLATGILDNQGRLIFCNDFLLELSGWKREEVIDQDWGQTFVPEDIRERDMCIINKSLERRIAPSYGESEIQIKSGERRTILWNNTLIINPNGSCGFASIGEDITERRAAEQRSLDLMLELKSVNSELKDFAYIVSHDLKAPLRGIRSLAEWIYSDYYDKFDGEGKEQLTMLMKRSKRMHNLLDGILRYSRLSYSKEDNTSINLNDIVMEAIQMLEPPDNISIIIDNELPLLMLNRTRTQQLFENLIDNAIKYMDKDNGQVRISCQNQGEFWQFSVQDNGCGIENRYFEKIFTIFQTLKSRDEFESTGIGLTIVNKIVELYGGKIWVESKIGEGSTFHFTLPTLQNCFRRINITK